MKNANQKRARSRKKELVKLVTSDDCGNTLKIEKMSGERNEENTDGERSITYSHVQDQLSGVEVYTGFETGNNNNNNKTTAPLPLLIRFP